MLATLESERLELRVLSETRSAVRGGAPGALAEFFEIAHRALRHLNVDIRSGRLSPPALLMGVRADQTLHRLAVRIAAEYPLTMESPFEGTATIAGGLWSGRALLDEDRDDGLAQLRFERGTQDLPLHIHEHSDRFIAVLRGQGEFHWSTADRQHFAGYGVRTAPVRAGDLLLFSRNLLHTFSAPESELVLLSYHSPEIAFNDPRQYTLPLVSWTPRSGLNEAGA